MIRMEQYLFLILLFTLEINSQDANGNPWNTSVAECVVPPPDAIPNGRFAVREDYLLIHLPDGKLHSYELSVTCSPGYESLPRGRQPSVVCIVNRTREELPECLPTCKISTSEILSCGVGVDDKESRCILPSGVSSVSRPTPVSLETARDLQCGLTATYDGTSSVSHGVKANRDDAPWHAGVYTKITRPYMQICGGTIVSTNVIISAAHCFWNAIAKKLPAQNFAVAVGKIYRPWDDPNDKDAQKSDIQEIRIPPRFHGAATNFQDDIAVLILKETLTFTPYVIPACLDFDYDFDETQLAHGKIGRVVGWGLTSEDGPASQILNKAELPVVNIEICAANADPSFLESITSDKICAGYNNGTSVCRGDSGGGLAFRENVADLNRYYLRGIVSTAPTNDHLCNVYAVATFTHIIKHERLIRNAISQSPPPNIVTENKSSNPPVLTTLDYKEPLKRPIPYIPNIMIPEDKTNQGPKRNENPETHEVPSSIEPEPKRPSVFKLEDEADFLENKKILVPNQEKSDINNGKIISATSSLIQPNLNVYNSKPYLLDKDHPGNQAINLQKPDQKQQSHWHPFTPETWSFFNQNFDGENPKTSKDKIPNSGDDKNSNLHDFMPEGYKLLRQHGLSHQSTNILINTHNGPVTIGDISSVVNFYYKSANKTAPNLGV